jgi:hypothetical protein
MSEQNELMEMIKQLQAMTQEVTNTTDPELDEYLKNMESMYDFQPNQNDNVDFNITTKFVNKSNNPDPSYAKVGDSGFDLRAFIEEPVTLGPLERTELVVLIPQVR